MTLSDSLSDPRVVRGVVSVCPGQVGGARTNKLPLQTLSNADVKGTGSHAGLAARLSSVSSQDGPHSLR